MSCANPNHAASVGTAWRGSLRQSRLRSWQCRRVLQPTPWVSTWAARSVRLESRPAPRVSRLERPIPFAISARPTLPSSSSPGFGRFPSSASSCRTSTLAPRPATREPGLRDGGCLDEGGNCYGPPVPADPPGGGVREGGARSNAGHRPCDVLRDRQLRLRATPDLRLQPHEYDLCRRRGRTVQSRLVRIAGRVRAIQRGRRHSRTRLDRSDLDTLKTADLRVPTAAR